MLELSNDTPYPAAIVPGLDVEGVDTVTVVVKGTFALPRAGGAPPVAREQRPLVDADEFHGEPGSSSIRYESERCPAKRGTDVVLVGSAVSRTPVPSLDVTLSCGPLQHAVRVFGDRAWFTLMGRAAISDPVPFSRMPLVYERAFGGGDAAVDDAARRPRDRRNPIGVGFTSAIEPARVEGVRLPNLEDPATLIARPADRPPIAGFGFVGRDWLPRVGYAGTYDVAWREERLPFLPFDFDERYFNGAHPRLVSPRPLRGGERVTVTNVVESGDVVFDVPANQIAVELTVRRRAEVHLAALDTLLIEPQEARIVTLWRVTLPCPRAILYVKRVRLSERRAG